MLRTNGIDSRRPDIVCFVNGIPLAVIEAKRPDGNAQKGPTIDEGVSQNIRNQRNDEIPQLFAYSQLLLSINGLEGRYGTQGTAKKFWAAWVQAIKVSVNAKVENKSISCGFMPINADPYIFNKCVINAESTNGTYWVAYQVQGDDSIIWLLYSKLSSGSYEQKIFDSYSSIESDKANFRHMHTESCPSLLHPNIHVSEQQLHVQRIFGC